MKPWLFDDFKLILEKHNPKNIAEIGVHKGITAVQIIKCLHGDVKINYTGYDVFDYAVKNSQFNKKEFNGKGGISFHYVETKLANLKKILPNFDFTLHQGYTFDTLEQQNFDFVYIDGGHSYETVKHDYEKVSGSKVIVFDDAFNINAPGVGKFIKDLENQNIKINFLKRWAYIEN